MSELALDGRSHARDDDEAGRLHFEPLDQFAIVKPLVCANDYRSYPLRKLSEAGLEQINDASGGVDVAGPQFSVPEVSALAFEAEQRMVGGSPVLERIVADSRLLLLSIDHEHG